MKRKQTLTPEPSSVHVALGDMVSANKQIGGSDSRLFNTWLIDSAMRSIWLHPETSDEVRNSQHLSVIVALHGFKPQNEIEAMLAAQAIAMHHASMEASRRAMLPDQPFEITQALRKSAANSSRAFCELVDALDRRRGKTSQQRVTVEHVHVHAGGQAIVGTVESGTTGGGVRAGSGEEPRASPAGLAHDATVGAVVPPVWSANPKRQPVLIAGDGRKGPRPDARRRQHRP